MGKASAESPKHVIVILGMVAPGGEPAADIAAAGDRREKVEAAKLPATGECLKHAECK